MQDVGHDRAVDVDIGKVFPKNTLDRLDFCISTCLGEFSSPFINRVESFNNFLGVARLKDTFPVAYLISRCRTDGTHPSLHQRDKNLFQIIPHISGKNWEAPPRSTISTDENDPLTPSMLQWLDDGLHAMVEKVRDAAATRSLIRDMTEFGCGEIGQQDLALLRRFSPNVLWNVADGEIDGVSLLATELCELGFVR